MLVPSAAFSAELQKNLVTASNFPFNSSCSVALCGLKLVVSTTNCQETIHMLTPALHTCQPRLGRTFSFGCFSERTTPATQTKTINNKTLLPASSTSSTSTSTSTSLTSAAVAVASCSSSLRRKKKEERRIKGELDCRLTSWDFSFFPYLSHAPHGVQNILFIRINFELMVLEVLLGGTGRSSCQTGLGNSHMGKVGLKKEKKRRKKSE